MVIEIEVDDITLFAKALNNAICAYEDIIWSIDLGCVPQINSNKFSKLNVLPEEELKKRFNALNDVYKQITKIEEAENCD